MTAEEILDSVKKLPPAPQTACRLMSLLQDRDQHNDEVVKIIQYDSVLTSKLLKICNSAYIAARAPIASLKQAVALLGYGEITRVVWQVSVGDTLDRQLEAYGMDAKALWHHSVTTAVASQKLRDFSSGPLEDASVAFTAGLLHDIGKVVLNNCGLPGVSAIREHIKQEQMSLIEAEKLALGVDHAEIGACLMERWNMPPFIMEAVANHHQPLTSEGPKLSAVVHLANSCAHCIDASLGVSSLATQHHADAIISLNLMPDHLEKTMMFVHEKSGKIESLLSMT